MSETLELHYNRIRKVQVMQNIVYQRMTVRMEVFQRLIATYLPYQLNRCVCLVEIALGKGHKVLFCNKVADACDTCLAVTAKVVSWVQETYILIGHILCGRVDNE